MKVIFLGLLFCEESLQDALKYSKVGVQYAPHKFQANLLRGLENCTDLDLHIINIPPTGSFPIHNKQLFSKKYTWGKQAAQMSFINLPFVKHIEQENKIIEACKKIIRRTKEIVHIVLYSPYKPFINACIKLKSRYNNVRLCLIQTDPIPGIDDLQRFMTPRARKNGEKILKKIQNIDSFVLLTSFMTKMLNVNSRPFTIIECVCDNTQAASKSSKDKNIVLYSGTLELEYGILDIAEAFTRLPTFELWIYGKGEAEESLRNLSQNYANIKFFGFACAEVIAAARDKCSFLINPRRPTGTFTKYSFPSKTAEYMLSGKPVIMYKLEGVPDEYDQYLNYLKAIDGDNLQKELGKVLSSDYTVLKEKALAAREFMMEQKGPLTQAKKLISMLEKIQ